MKIEWNRKYNTIAVYAFLVVVASIVFLAGVLNFQWLMGMTMKIINLLMPFIYGFVMAYILNPVLHFIESKIFPPLFGDRGSYKLRRALSIFLTYLFAFFTIGVFFSSVIPQIVESVYNLASRIPSYLGSIEGIIRQIVAETNSVDLPSDVVDSLVISFEDALNSLYAVGPKILGQSTGLSAFWVVFSIMLFGGLFGFVGMFIGVPTFAVIYSNIRAFAERRLRRKNLPLATRDYAVDAHDLVD